MHIRLCRSRSGDNVPAERGRPASWGGRLDKGCVSQNNLRVPVSVKLKLIRSILNYRNYIPQKNLHDPFEGKLLEMWEKE